MAAEILFGPRRSRGSEWFEAAICLLETPHFSTRKYKKTRILVFLIVFHNVTGEQLNIELFLILTVRLGLSQASLSL